MNDKPRYAVFGNPVAHSRSPEIHSLFAEQENVEIEYARICAEEGGFAAAAEKFFAEGGMGANVTVPFKTDAFDWVDERSARAEEAGAVNTLISLGGGRFLGANTDGAGLVGDIVRQGFDIKGKRILLLGAGGAVRGVIPALLDAAPAGITVANRTPEKARVLAERFGVQTALMDELDGGFDIIINGTSGGLSGQLPQIPPDVFSDCLFAYDMVYGSGAERFLDFARRNGAAQVSDGLGMLITQAAESYRLWRGFEPDVSPVVESMRSR